MKDWRRNVEQGVYSKVKCIERQGTFYMFEHRTHSTQVFQEGVLGSVVREAGQDHRRLQHFIVSEEVGKAGAKLLPASEPLPSEPWLLGIPDSAETSESSLRPSSLKCLCPTN